MLPFLVVQKNNVEVLFCYEPYDEVVLMQLKEFNSKSIISVEKQMRLDKDTVDFDGSELLNVQYYSCFLLYQYIFRENRCHSYYC